MSPKRFVLHFVKSADQPVIYHLVKDFDLMVNILRADVNHRKEGTMALEIIGERYEEGLAYLREQGVLLQPLSQEVVRDENRCVHCGLCTDVCPSGALIIDRPSMEVLFDGDNCVVCKQCVETCPHKAMEVRF